MGAAGSVRRALQPACLQQLHGVIDMAAFHRRYRSDEQDLLGAGAFAKVYSGHEKASGKRVAIKRIAKKDQRGDNVIDPRYLQTEIDALRRASGHPNVLRMYDVFEDPAHVFLVIEYAPGGTVMDHLYRFGAYHESAARVLLTQLTRAVLHLHRKRIVHRDLKPENLLLADAARGLQLKVADFGLSKIIEDSKKATPRSPLQSRKSRPLVPFTASGARAPGQKPSTRGSLLQRTSSGLDRGYGSVVRTRAVKRAPEIKEAPAAEALAVEEPDRRLTRGMWGGQRLSRVSPAAPQTPGEVDARPPVAPNVGAAVLASPAAAADQLNLLKTQCGSRIYAAPEVLAGVAYDRGCDLWGIGMCAHMILTGLHPMDVDENYITRVKSEADYTLNDALWHGKSPLAKHLVSKLLRRKPRHRPGCHKILAHAFCRAPPRPQQAGSPRRLTPLAALIAAAASSRRIPGIPGLRRRTLDFTLPPTPSLRPYNDLAASAETIPDVPRDAFSPAGSAATPVFAAPGRPRRRTSEFFAEGRPALRRPSATTAPSDAGDDEDARTLSGSFDGNTFDEDRPDGRRGSVDAEAGAFDAGRRRSSVSWHVDARRSSSATSRVSWHADVQHGPPKILEADAECGSGPPKILEADDGGSGP
ncbi:kinase-like domain-containing protein [Pelagophyceae sp. CCMP2097]|nr:kinase-like domain-containing protein [Pelagophyceae sp. CCMP2097]